MTTNQTFSPARFWRLVRWDVMTNWKSYLMWFLGTYSLLTLILIFETNEFADMQVMRSDKHSYEVCFQYTQWNLARELLGRSLAIAYLAVLFLASGFMNQMHSKGGRTTYLMLPASNLEKFLCRTLIIVTSSLLFTTAGFALADLTRYLCLPLMGVNLEIHQIFLTPGFLKNVGMWMFGLPGEYYGVPETCAWMRPWGYFLHALCIFNACYWVRFSGWKSIGIIFLFVWLGTRTAIYYENNLDDIASLNTWLNIIYWSLTVLCWLTAYRLFCRSQVVEPKRFR